LWARLLTGEAATPGRFSKRTVDFVATFDKKDAELFTKFAQFVWHFSDGGPLIYDISHQIYAEEGLSFASVIHLSSIGLLTYSQTPGYRRVWDSKIGLLAYYDQPLIIEFSETQPNQINAGTCMLSAVGQELLPVCGAHKNEAFFEYVVNKWANEGLCVYSPLRYIPDPKT